MSLSIYHHCIYIFYFIIKSPPLSSSYIILVRVIYVLLFPLSAYIMHIFVQPIRKVKHERSLQRGRICGKGESDLESGKGFMRASESVLDSGRGAIGLVGSWLNREGLMTQLKFSLFLSISLQSNLYIITRQRISYCLILHIPSHFPPHQSAVECRVLMFQFLVQFVSTFFFFFSDFQVTARKIH